MDIEEFLYGLFPFLAGLGILIFIYYIIPHYNLVGDYPLSESWGAGLIGLILVILGVGTWIYFYVPPYNGSYEGYNTSVNTAREYQRREFNPNESFLMKRIVAPVIVGLILGGITFLITGNFAAGGGVSLVGTLVINLFNS